MKNSFYFQCLLCESETHQLLYPIQAKLDEKKPALYQISEHVPDEDLSIAVCKQCGFAFLTNSLDTNYLLANYENMQDLLYLQEEEGRRLYAQKILKSLKSHRPLKGRLLDIGCGCGFLLDEARKQGWEVWGIELSDWAVQYAKTQLTLENIIKGDFLQISLPENFFDVIVMTDVIEHFCNPKDGLEKTRRHLSSQGVLCLTTPDISSLARKIFKKKWWGFHRTHLYYFNPKTLKNILLKTGFITLSIHHFPRVFTWEYWMKNFSSHHCLGKVLLKFLEKFPQWKTKLLSLNLWDQIIVMARKKRLMQDFISDEIVTDLTAQAKQKVIVVLPAYQAKKTLSQTIQDIPKEFVNDIVLVDDGSSDGTFEEALRLGIKAFQHDKNQGYGANQKTCYRKALDMGADIVVMVHPDYQYDPKAIPDLIEPILKARADAVFGSRMMKGGALEGGMPRWKYNANILLTALENVILGIYLTEYHSGFRAYSRKYLMSIDFESNDPGFVFDTEIIVQGVLKDMRFEEIPIRTRYFDEASSIKLGACLIYGMNILKVLLKFLLCKMGWRLKPFQ